MKPHIAARYIHRYVTLFIAPWILLYAISGLVLNHREFFREQWGTMAETTPECEFVYDGTFPPDAPPRVIAGQLLDDVGYPGAFNANERNGVVTINRIDATAPRRIRYNTADGTVTVERTRLMLPELIRRLHLRRGYQHDRFADDAWAFTVDLAILAIFTWLVTGIMMWRAMPRFRRTGLVVLAGGTGLFVFFILAL